MPDLGACKFALICKIAFGLKLFSALWTNDDHLNSLCMYLHSRLQV